MINLDQIDSSVAKEVLMLFIYGDEKTQKKVPDSLIKKLTKISSTSDKEVKITNIENIENEVSEDALNIFSILYYAFIADEDEKKDILSSWINNEQINIEGD